MAEKDITKVKANTALSAPDFMHGAPRGTEELGHYVIPARLKIVQKQSSDELLQEFGQGYVIIMKGDGSAEEVAKMKFDEKGNPVSSEGFNFVPLFFFVEYVCWNPIQLKGVAPAIRSRSLDPRSEVALKAKSVENRTAPHPDGKGDITYSEHLNFVVLVDGQTEPAIITFARGTHKHGRALCNLIKMRKAPIYGCRIHANLTLESNELGSWWAYDCENPDNPWVDAETEFRSFQEIHKEYAEFFADAKIRVDYGEGESSEEETTNEF